MRVSPVVRPPAVVARRLAFLDIVELDLLRRLKEKGVSTRRLILLAAEAALALGFHHPLSRRGVRVELSSKGARVYLPMPAGPDREGLLHLGTTGQMALKEVVEQVSEWLDFDESHATALRWWPAGRSGGVVVDPEVAFGEPVVPDTRVSAGVLHELLAAEGADIARVAMLYELSPDAVRDAVAFARERMTRPCRVSGRGKGTGDALARGHAVPHRRESPGKQEGTSARGCGRRWLQCSGSSGPDPHGVQWSVLAARLGIHLRRTGGLGFSLMVWGNRSLGPAWKPGGLRAARRADPAVCGPSGTARHLADPGSEAPGIPIAGPGRVLQPVEALHGRDSGRKCRV